MTGKQYAERDIENLEPYYSTHVLAMTRENLRAKSEIAAELAWRDARIGDLYEALGTMMALARTKWGNMDEDFNVCYAQARLVREKVRGEEQ